MSDGKPTKRELECLIGLGEGLRYDDIAKKLNIAPKTVSTHIWNLKIKWNIHGGVVKLLREAQVRGVLNFGHEPSAE